MLITEYRIPLPLTLEEYQLGQLYSTAELSMLETGGGEGVEFLENEYFKGTPTFDDRFDSGVHTVKVYHLASKIPQVIRLLIEKNKMDILEDCWNAYPYCRTILTNPGYMKNNFSLIIESMHLSDRGEHQNAHQLPPDLLEKRNIVNIDIGNDPFPRNDFKKDLDPSVFRSEKADRGPLVEDWIYTSEPVMTCYKLVRAEFKWFGLQKKVENYIMEVEQKLFLKFHRQLFCWIDKWYDLTLDEIRQFEEQVKYDLEIRRNRGSIKKALFDSQIVAL